ncbi:hypothetical protein IFM89_009191, partial [Coptis chinensis]
KKYSEYCRTYVCCLYMYNKEGSLKFSSTDQTPFAAGGLAADASEEALYRLPTSAPCMNLLKLPPYGRTVKVSPIDIISAL